MFCQKCGAEALSSQRFCGSCGADLSAQGKSSRLSKVIIAVVIVLFAFVFLRLAISSLEVGTEQSSLGDTNVTSADPNTATQTEAPKLKSPSPLPSSQATPAQETSTENEQAAPGDQGSTNFGADPLIAEPVDKYQPCAEATGPLPMSEQFDYSGLPSDEWQTFFLFSDSGVDAYVLRVGKSPSAIYLWRVVLVFQGDWARREQLAKYLDLLAAPPGAIYVPPGLWYGRNGSNDDEPPDWQAVADFKYAIFSMDWMTEENPGQPSIAQVHMYAPLKCHSWTQPGQAPTSEIGMIAFGPPFPPVAPDSVLYKAAIDMNKVASRGK